MHASQPGHPCDSATAPGPTFLRLRQVCLVAAQLEPVVEDLCAVFDLQVCHRDPEVARFGLHNALMPIGHQFIEVVAPLQPGTAAGRYLARRGGDGGYMAILDSESLPRWRAHLARVDARLAAALTLGDYEGLQLHPRDTGGALLEINHTRGGASLTGAYGPAGPHWQSQVRTERVRAITALGLQGEDATALAQRWAQILARPLQAGSDLAVGSLALDNARLDFMPLQDARGEGVARITLQVRDAAAVRRAAQARGLPTQADCVTVGGVHFLLDER